MLTKEERAAIARRIEDINVFNDRTFYTAITGECVPKETSYRENLATISRVVFDLCSMPNAIELPFDRDGEVIYIGDIVFDKHSCRAYRVRGYEFNLDRCVVILGDDANACSMTYLEPDVLIHKKPVTIKSLVKELIDIVAADYGTPMVVKHKISNIAEQLKNLGDNDE